MRFWRSQAYSDFFEYLDSKGGFFYERWGASLRSVHPKVCLANDDPSLRRRACAFHRGGAIPADIGAPSIRRGRVRCLRRLVSFRCSRWSGRRYRHVPYTHCPVSTKLYHSNGKCFCDPGQSFDLDGALHSSLAGRVGLSD